MVSQSKITVHKLTSQLLAKFSQPIKIMSQSKTLVHKFDQSASGKIFPTNQNGEPITNLNAEIFDQSGFWQNFPNKSKWLANQKS